MLKLYLSMFKNKVLNEFLGTSSVLNAVFTKPKMILRGFNERWYYSVEIFKLINKSSVVFCFQWTALDSVIQKYVYRCQLRLVSYFHVTL